MNVVFKASTLLAALHKGGFLTKLETERVSVERPDKLITIGETETTVRDIVDMIDGESDVELELGDHTVGENLAEAIRYIKTGQTVLARSMLSRLFGSVAMAHAEEALRA